MCKLLLIDNITAYAWHDRALKPPAINTTTTTPAAAAAGRAPGHISTNPSTAAAGGAGAGTALTWQAAQSALARLVRHTCDRLHLAAVVTRQTMVKATGDTAAGGGVSLDTWDQLPPAWQVRKWRGTNERHERTVGKGPLLLWAAMKVEVCITVARCCMMTL